MFVQVVFHLIYGTFVVQRHINGFCLMYCMMYLNIWLGPLKNVNISKDVSLVQTINKIVYEILARIILQQQGFSKILISLIRFFAFSS